MSGPSCSPTRAALLTGMHEFRNGVTHTIIPRQQLHESAVLVPELLKSVGYLSGFIGKWHLETNLVRKEGLIGALPTNPDRLNTLIPPLFGIVIVFKPRDIGEDIFFNEAMVFIEEAKDRPFFCYLSTYSPHTPLDVHPKNSSNHFESWIKRYSFDLSGYDRKH